MIKVEKKNQGFTLVELLVVIAIIAILAVVVLVAINPIDQLKKSRNARRLDNLAAVNSAISTALTEATGGGAPFTLNQAADSCGSPATWVVIQPGNGASLAKYLPALPKDPLNDVANGYCYYFKADSTGQQYKLSAKLEDVGDAVSQMASDGGTNNARFETGINVTIVD